MMKFAASPFDIKAATTASGLQALAEESLAKAKTLAAEARATRDAARRKQLLEEARQAAEAAQSYAAKVTSLAR